MSNLNVKPTPEQLELMKPMSDILKENPDVFEQEQEIDERLIANSTSARDVVNAEASLEEFQTMETAIDEEEEKIKQELRDSIPPGAEKEYSTQEDEPGYTPPQDADQTIIETEESLKGGMQKQYEKDLDTQDLQRLYQLREEIEELKSSDENYTMLSYTTGGGFGPETKISRTMKPEAREKLRALTQEAYNLTSVSHIRYAEEVNNKYQEALNLQDETSYVSSERTNYQHAEVLYGKVKKLLDADAGQKGVGAGIIDQITDPNFVTLNLADLAINARLIKIAKKYEDNRELNDSEISLLDAYTTLQDVQNNTHATLREGYTMASETTAMLPYMAEFLLTLGQATAVRAGVRKALQNASSKYLSKGLGRKLGDFSAKVGSEVAAVYTQAALMPSVQSDMRRRVLGELAVDRDPNGLIQVHRDENGKMSGLYMGKELQDMETQIALQSASQQLGVEVKSVDELKRLIKNERVPAEIRENLMEHLEYLQLFKPLSAFKAIGKAWTAGAIEAATERIGGEFAAKSIKKLGRRTGLSHRLARTKAGKAFSVNTSFGRGYKEFARGVGFQGFGAEFIEELMNIPMNAALVGDSKLEELWDKQVWKRIAIQTGAISALMAGGGTLMNLPGRLVHSEFFQKRQEHLKKLAELKAADPNNIDDIIEFSLKTGNIIALKKQANMLRKEGKVEEANQIEEKILTNQMMKAFENQTVEEFEDAMDMVATNKKASGETRQVARKVLELTRALKSTHKLYKDLPNIRNILNLQVNENLAKQQIADIDKTLMEENLAENVLEDIRAIGKEQGFDVPEDLSSEDLFTKEYSSTGEKGRKSYTNEDKQNNHNYQLFLSALESANISSVNRFRALTETRAELEKMVEEKRVLFNEQVSQEYQQKLKDEDALFKIIRTDKELEILESEEKINETKYKKRFNQLLRENRGSLSEKRIREIRKVRDIKLKGLKRIKEAQAKAKAARLAEKEKERKQLKEKKVETVATEKEVNESEKKADEINRQLQIKFENDINKTIESGENSTIVREDTDLFKSARNLSNKITEAQKESIKQNIQSMYDSYKELHGKEPTFEQLLETFIENSSPELAEEFYNVLTFGWELNNYEETNFDKIYNKVFSPYREAVQKILNDESIFDGTTTEPEVQEAEKKKLKDTEQDIKETVDYTEENVPIKDRGIKTVDSDLKFGYLSIAYEEEIDTNGVIHKKSTSDDLLLDGIIDYREILDPDKFQPGTVAEVRLATSAELGKMFMTTRDSKGRKKVETYANWLTRNKKDNPEFESTQQFKNEVPMLIISSETGRPVSYVHGVSWYVPANIGYAENKPRQLQIIEDGRKKVTALREHVLKNGTSEIEITAKEGLAFHKIDPSKPAPTLDQNGEVGKDVFIGVATEIGEISTATNVSFEIPGKRKIVGRREMIKKGRTYNLRLMGKTPAGVELWMPFEVLRGEKANNYALTQEDHDTLRWAFAASFTLSPWKSYLRKEGVTPPEGINEELAKQIAEDIRKETGWDITQREGLFQFMEQYVHFGNFEYAAMAKKLLNQDTTVARDLRQHTSLVALGINPKTIRITPEGKVEPTGKTYQNHLMSTLKSPVKSFNVGTAEEPKWVTAIHPRVNFVLKEELEQQKAEEEQIKETEIIAEEVSPKTIEDSADDLLGEMGLDDDVLDTLASVVLPNTQKLKSISETTEGLTIIQEFQLVDYLFNRTSDEIGLRNTQTVDKNILERDIKKAYKDTIEPRRQKLKDKLEELRAAHAKNPSQRLADLMVKYSKALKIFENIYKNWDNLKAKAFSQAKLTKEDEEGDTSQRERDYNKSSLEENSKDKTSYRLRKFFRGTEQRDKKGNVKKGFLGLPLYMNFNDVYDTVAQILSSPNETVADFDIMMDKLEKSVEAHPWLRGFIDKMRDADTQIKYEFVSNFAKHALTMKFVMYNVDRSGNYHLKIYDTNSHEITRLIRDQWTNNFKVSRLIKESNTTYEIDKDRINLLLEETKDWYKTGKNIDTEVMRAWLKDNFGITLSKNTFEHLSKRGMYYRGKHYGYSRMFAKGKSTLFGLLRDYLEKASKMDNLLIEENPRAHPFTDMAGMLKALSLVESKFTKQASTLSFRDNGKNIFGLTPSKFATDRVLQLKQYENGVNTLVDDMLDISLSSESFILKLLQMEEDFRGKFSLHHIGITALNQLGKRATDYSSITDLTDFDKEIVSFGGFQDLKQGTVTAAVNEDGDLVERGNMLTMRMANMLYPTMSDKSQMLLSDTAVFNFYKDAKTAFDIDSNGNIHFSDLVKNLLYNQLVLPEIKRILKHNSTIKKTNIRGYDVAASMFHFIPALNNIKTKDGVRIIEAMKTDPDVHNEAWIKENFKDQIDEVVKNVIDAEVKAKKELWESSAIIRDAKDNITKIKFFDKDYMNQIDTKELASFRYELGLYDFVLNSFLSNMNIFTTVSGDPAQYASESLYNSFGADNSAIEEMVGLFGKAHTDLFDIYDTHGDFLNALDKAYAGNKITKTMYERMKKEIKPSIFNTEDTAFLNMAKKNGVNIGKRLALLIAPGVKMANSIDEQYLEVFLKDPIDIASNIEYLISLYYGPDALKESLSALSEMRDPNANEASKEITRKNLKKKFPKIGGYFDIESADGQEYTTANEHINILRKLGRIPDTVYEEVKKKLEAGEELNKKELGFVLQPIKPVYTGQIIDKDQDIARTVYIKSSSFPLLPQLTGDQQLDNLRVAMEALEKRRNMPVRAAYITATKVGSTNSTIDINKPISERELEASSLKLNRNDFRIQQDVPFKSDIQKEDKVSMGTQIFRLLFGDGMLDEEGFELDGKTLTGRELYDHFNTTFGEIIRAKKMELYDELGLDNHGVPRNTRESMEKLQNLLQKEANDRNFPRQDVKGLELVEKIEHGRVYYDFKLPLWLSSNSNRYESLLNAIVTNRIIKHKIPGNSFVIGSEVGFNYTTDLTRVKIGYRGKSKIVYLNGYTGGELKGVSKKSNGTLQKAQVLIPSKFKDTKGNLIDLFKTDKRGRYIYLKQRKGKLILNENKFDKELLDNFSFRTPTSFHASASIIEIAGILPPEVGDLMIVPKNFITQKGLDYDIDKETSYALHHYHNTKSGVIEVLQRKHVDKVMEGFRKRIKDLRASGALPGDIGVAMEGFDNILVDALGEKLLEEIIFSEDAILEERMDRVRRKMELKLLENEFVKVHKSVFNNPNDEVQRKINKVLSMDFARNQADYIESLEEASENLNNFSLLSDEYQKKKMGLGSAGKMAIGVYSNAVTLHGLMQQVRENRRLNLTRTVTSPLGESVLVDFGVQIGNLVSDGKFGEIMTLDGDRMISEVLAEKQNTATDNEKEQILGRTHINRITIGVDSLLTMLGFDKGDKVDGKETSIPYLFLSQPIIKAYVKEMEATQAITSDYTPDRNAVVINRVLEKFNPKDTTLEEVFFKAENNMFDQEMTTGSLVEGIKTGGENMGELQIGILLKFLELKEYADAVTSLQSLLNTRNLGKSIVETNIKYQKLNVLPENSKIRNASELIGEFLPIDAVMQRPSLEHINIGDYWVKPDTPQGQIVVHGIKTGYDLWNQYFPYQDEAVMTAVGEIMKITGTNEKSDNAKINMMYDIFKQMRRYINSGKVHGIFTEDASIERKRLFIDEGKHQSLAGYLNEITSTALENADSAEQGGIESLQLNKLISRFTYELNKDGNPSLIKYNNTRTESFDEDYLYNAMAELVINNQKLPDFNGQPYDTKKLVADLVTYAYVEGGVQEAIQFVKYIPIEYLESLGFTKAMQAYSTQRYSNVMRDVLGIVEFNEDNKTETHRFAKQFIQHNPQMARQLSPQEVSQKLENKDKAKGRLQSFTFVTSMELPKFLTIRNSTNSRKKQDKFSLFQHKGNGEYVRISILGTHGMNEYSMHKDENISLLEKRVPEIEIERTTTVLRGKRGIPADIFNIKGGNIQEILSNIKNMKGIKYNFPLVVKLIEPFIDNNVKVLVESLPDGVDGQSSLEPILNRTTGEKTFLNTISVDTRVMESNNHEYIARIFVHEYIHSIVNQELFKYFHNTGEIRKDENGLPIALPPHIEQLYRVFNAAKREIRNLEIYVSKIDEGRNDYGSDIDYSKGEKLSFGEVGYGVQDIYEFVTTAFLEPAFQKRMMNTPYMKTKDSLWTRFVNAVKSMLIGNNLRSDLSADEISVAEAALGSILNLMEVSHGKRSRKYKNVPPAPTRQQEEEYIRRINKEIDEGKWDRMDWFSGPKVGYPTDVLENLPDICK